MAEEKKIENKVEEAVKDTTAESKEKEGVVKFTKSYSFEGKEYTEIDLSGLSKLTVNDAIKAQSQLIDEQETAAALVTERTTAFARHMAAKATGYPIEFFKYMSRGAMKSVQRAVVSSLVGKAESENHVMKFEKPYMYEGSEYTEIDLNGIADMTSMNESEAENRLVRAGITIIEPTYNYLYACIIASMATGKPEKFFEGLPIVELLKLKTEVNDPDFFE